MKIRDLKANEVKFIIKAEQDDLRVRGNISDSGDEAFDKRIEDQVLERLDYGDIWAWASVEVQATWEGFSGRDYLGACSYKDEEDFKADGYYEDMCKEALKDLNDEIRDSWKTISKLIVEDK
jgi:hypothetical protein